MAHRSNQSLWGGIVLVEKSLTTCNSEQDVRETDQLGANTYLVKPVDPHEFLEVIRKIHEFWFGAVTLPQAFPDFCRKRLQANDKTIASRHPKSLC